MKKKSISILLVTVMVLILLPQSAFAQQPDFTEEITLFSVAEDALPDNDELFSGYVNSLFYPDLSYTLFHESASSRLNAAEQVIYTRLSEQIKRIADGTTSSAVIEIPVAGIPVKSRWTADDLGVESLDLERDVPAVSAAFSGQSNLSAVIKALLYDFPYELYWYDKISGVRWGFRIGYSKMGETITSIGVTAIKFVFQVAQSYRAENYQFDTPAVNQAITLAPKKAVAAAKKIVDDTSSLPDYNKLIAYRDKIHELTDYNHSAADDDSTPYGDPWQLIYVFDGDASTKVVCEGYSKAFQYLCDISEFKKDITCYSVGGEMNSGAHMWNIITMDDGQNYLADITNSDTGAIGNHGGLFLAGASGSIADGYTVSIGSRNILYDYRTHGLDKYGQPIVNNKTITFWGDSQDSILFLSESNYIPDIHIEPLPGFADKITVENTDDSTFSISPKSDYTLSDMNLYTAVYMSDGSLKSLDVTPCKPQNGIITVSVSRPDIQRGETYRIMLWSDNATPVAHLIH